MFHIGLLSCECWVPFLSARVQILGLENGPIVTSESYIFPSGSVWVCPRAPVQVRKHLEALPQSVVKYNTIQLLTLNFDRLRVDRDWYVLDQRCLSCRIPCCNFYLFFTRPLLWSLSSRKSGYVICSLTAIGFEMYCKALSLTDAILLFFRRLCTAEFTQGDGRQHLLQIYQTMIGSGWKYTLHNLGRSFPMNVSYKTYTSTF